jgi:hypothetical protein
MMIPSEPNNSPAAVLDDTGQPLALASEGCVDTGASVMGVQ